jgi:hypothetical protein
MRVWAPYGGPRLDDVLVLFGLTPEKFHRRITRLLTSAASGELTFDDPRMIEALLSRSQTSPVVSQSAGHDRRGVQHSGTR